MPFLRSFLLTTIFGIAALVPAFSGFSQEAPASEEAKPRPAEGGPDSALGRSTWEIFLAGKAAGEETFSMTQTPDGWTHRSEAVLSMGGKRVSLEALLETGDRGEPLRYTLEATSGETVQRIAVEFGDKELQARASGTAGEPPRERTDPYDERPFILDNNFFSHYFYLVHQFHAAARDRLLAFVYIPQALSLVEAVVEKEGVEAAEINGVSVPLHKIFVNIAGTVGVNVYYDAKREPVKITAPVQQAAAVRSNYEPVPVPLLTEDKEEAASEPEPEPRFREEAAAFSNGGVTLAGTLTLPLEETGDGGASGGRKKKRGKKYPAVVLLSGSGAQDRDGNTIGSGGVQSSFYRLMAERLAEAGIAALRFDDRGVGGSGGNLKEASLRDLVGDARAALRSLRSRKDVRKKDLTLIGHSEGGILALLLAAEKAPGLSRLVLLGAPSSSLKDVLREQLELVPAGELRDATREAQDELFALAAKGDDVGEFRGQSVNLKWFREHFQTVPAETAKKVKIPVLILHAEHDRQVLRHHANRLYEALEEAGAPVTLRFLDGLDHFYLPSTSGTLAELGRTREHTDEPFASVAKWLREGEL
jgi:alpha-beta hydrolase superfamily lysophospholipase